MVSAIPEVDAMPDLLSVTLNVNGVAETVVVGVPVIAPLAVRFNPAGSVPELSVQEYGPIPPLCCNCALYFAPAKPSGKLVVVTVRDAGETVE
jgi:hypothetical protein